MRGEENENRRERGGDGFRQSGSARGAERRRDRREGECDVSAAQQHNASQPHNVSQQHSSPYVSSRTYNLYSIEHSTAHNSTNTHAHPSRIAAIIVRCCFSFSEATQLSASSSHCTTSRRVASRRVDSAALAVYKQLALQCRSAPLLSAAQRVFPAFAHIALRCRLPFPPPCRAVPCRAVRGANRQQQQQPRPLL